MIAIACSKETFKPKLLLQSKCELSWWVSFIPVNEISENIFLNIYALVTGLSNLKICFKRQGNKKTMQKSYINS